MLVAASCLLGIGWWALQDDASSSSSPSSVSPSAAGESAVANPTGSTAVAVAAGDTIGLVEVMKSFNEVKAEAGGKLVRFLVENEDAVMAGQPIAELEG